MPEAYYRVPAFTAKSISFERGGRLGVTVSFPEVEETAIDHALVVVGGLGLFAVGAVAFPGLAGVAAMLAGGFLAGWAANNVLIAWRCERREEAEA